MDTRSLAVFISVADTLSFSRSSEQLHMSVSAVSRTIQRLEAELGQALLVRDNRSVRLTGAGQEFREYARRSVAEWQQMRRQLGTDKELAGEVSLYCSVTATYSVLAPILEAFRTTHPAVEIMMHTGDQADGISRVLSGQDDIAVSGRPLRLPQRLEFLPLLESPLCLWMPAADCAVRQLALSAQVDSPEFGWSSLPFIVPERGITKDILDAWLRDSGIRPRVYAQVAGHEAIVAMVGLGLGVGIAPELVVRASGLGASVQPMAVADSLPPLAIGLASLRRRLQNPLVKSLWDVAGQTYRAAV